MIHEIASILVQPGSEARFEEGVSKARPLFERAQGCHGLELHRCIEEPQRYTLVVRWDTVDDHMVRFRNSEDFQQWRRLVGDCFAQPPLVHHEQQVL